MLTDFYKHVHIDTCVFKLKFENEMKLNKNKWSYFGKPDNEHVGETIRR